MKDDKKLPGKFTTEIDFSVINDSNIQSFPDIDVMNEVDIIELSNGKETRISTVKLCGDTYHR